MKKVLSIVLMLVVLFGVSACGGYRGKIGKDEFCVNETLFGVISIGEIVNPCGDKAK
jgi:hypothetical protein